MPITPTEAAEVARRHGLSLHDAAGLVSLAADVDDANAIAARFAAAEGSENAEVAREYTRQLFGKYVDPDEVERNRPPDPPTMRQFVARMFHRED